VPVAQAPRRPRAMGGAARARGAAAGVATTTLPLAASSSAPRPLALGCAAAAALAAAAGSVPAACACLAAAVVLDRASRRSVPLPADVARLAPPTSALPAGRSAPFSDGARTVDPARLQAAIGECMRSQLEAGTQVGMAVAVYYRGRQVAHVCGGVYRSMGGTGGEWRAVDADTLFMSYSVCKGVAAAGLMTCVDRGECAYADKVAAAWPEFAQGGKADVSIAQAVSHRAGMPGLSASFLPVVGAHLAAGFRGWRSAWRAGLAFIEQYVPEWPPGTMAQVPYACPPVHRGPGTGSAAAPPPERVRLHSLTTPTHPRPPTRFFLSRARARAHTHTHTSTTTSHFRG